MISTIDKEIIQYFSRLNDSQKQSLLAMMKSFLNHSDIQQPSISIEQYNNDLNEAMKRINDGSFTTLEELEKEMQSW